MDHRTVLFVDTGRWTCFDQLSAALRRRGYETVRVTTESGGLSRFMSRMAYDRQVVLRSLADLSQLPGRMSVNSIVDIHCTEAVLHAVYSTFDQTDISPSVRENMRWRLLNLDKYEMTQRLRNAGVSVAITLPGTTPASEAFTLAGSPLVVKARVGFGGSNVAVVDTVAAAEDAVRRFGGGEAVYFEELIVGDNIRYVSCRDDDVLQEAVFVTRRRDPQSLGPATGVELIADESMAQLGRTALNTIGGRGLANVEAMRTDGGRICIIDMNLRVWGSAVSLRAAGPDFVSAYCRSLGDLTVPVLPVTVAVGSYLDVFPDSAVVAMENGPFAVAIAVFCVGVWRYRRQLGSRYMVAATALLASTFRHRIKRHVRKASSVAR